MYLDPWTVWMSGDGAGTVELLAKMADVHVDRVEEAFALPDGLTKPGSRHDSIRMTHQHGEDGNLLRGQIDRLVASRRAAPDEVEGQVSHAEYG
jgi:hypothetical protein